ncbi:hypothetical protein M885DRAFT_530611 [Pelagophyceae sp. CCMP2097]|nr:hypothetical protein M885DRAFT_530611 [Pelagophyceae sp. CCMP2097]
MAAPQTPPRRILSQVQDQQSASFYNWQTPGKPGSDSSVALSHPNLRLALDTCAPTPATTPLSKLVSDETAVRDAKIGLAYVARHQALKATGQTIECTFQDALLGFKVCLGRVGTGASTRRRILVEETFPACAAAELRPHDELVAVNGDLLIEIDAEAFDALVVRLRRMPRPLALTFAKGADRDRAFSAQQRARAVAAVAHAAASQRTAAPQHAGAPQRAGAPQPREQHAAARAAAAGCPDEGRAARGAAAGFPDEGTRWSILECCGAKFTCDGCT